MKESSDFVLLFFLGGAPAPHLPFAIHASESILQELPSKILRICFEWNGYGRSTLVRRASDLSLITGETVKFDLECFKTLLCMALSGVSN